METETAGRKSVINLGWLNDSEVSKRVKELSDNGEVFECTKSDVRGYDSVYTSKSGKYQYHVCSN